MARKGGLSVKRIEKLTARPVKPGRFGDGHGLYLQVKSEDNISWCFRYERTVHDPETGQPRRRERMLGLGPLHTYTLEEARERARKVRQQLKDGDDPLAGRKAQKMRHALDAARSMTFRQCAGAYFEANADGWRNEKHKKQFLSTLTTYAFPIIGDLPIADIDVTLILRVLEQKIAGRDGVMTTFWRARTETATRVRSRMEMVLSWATVRGYRSGDNPAKWTGFLSTQLPGRGKAFAPVRHHPALPYADIPAFMSDLRKRTGTSAAALQFTVLTAARTGAVIGATWDEIDLEAKVWTVPPDRAGVKIEGNQPRRVPLSEPAITLLKALPRGHSNPHVFIGTREGEGLSNMSMLEVMREVRPGYVPHGLRSTFKDWCSECTSYPNHVSEAALWHVVADKVEAAYRRGDLFEKRRRLMAEWGRYCASPMASSAKVLPLRGKR